MRVVYNLMDTAGREMTAECEGGFIKVVMNFCVDKSLTPDEVFETLGWTIIGKKEYEEPKVLPFKRKD